jgi:hypothetical protein
MVTIASIAIYREQSAKCLRRISGICHERLRRERAPPATTLSGLELHPAIEPLAAAGVLVESTGKNALSSIARAALPQLLPLRAGFP